MNDAYGLAAEGKPSVSTWAVRPSVCMQPEAWFMQSQNLFINLVCGLICSLVGLFIDQGTTVFVFL